MDFFLKVLLITCLFFLTFAFAGAEPWAFSIAQGLVLVSAVLWVFSHKHWISTPLFKITFWGLSFLIGYALLQSLFPHTLLDPSPWYPSTLVRLYTLEHASYFITYLVVVFLICQLAVRTPNVRHFMLAAALCGLAVAATINMLPAGSYIGSLTGRHAGLGPFLNRNHAGVFLAMTTLLMMGYNLSGLLQQYRQGKNSSLYCRQTAGWLIVLALGISCVYTRSRGAMLSLGVGAFVYGLVMSLFLPSTKAHKFKWFLLWGVTLGLAIWLTSANVDAINEFARRTGGFSIETRKMLYRAAENLLAKNPYWGIGIGAMPVAITSYMETPLSSYVERLHNDWLELLLGMGYVGILPLVFIFGCFIWRVSRRLNRIEPYKKMVLGALVSCLSAMCVGCLVDFDFSIPAVAFLFFISLGLVASPSFDKGNLHIHSLSIFKKILIIVVMTGAMWLPLQKTRAWRLFLFGKGLRPEAKIALYEQGLSIYDGPRFALRLGNAYYNAAWRVQEETQRRAYLEQALELAQTYLKKYPKDKELSRLYMRARRALSTQM